MLHTRPSLKAKGGLAGALVKAADAAVPCVQDPQVAVAGHEVHGISAIIGKPPQLPARLLVQDDHG